MGLMGNYECKISCFINFDAVSAANKHSACHKSRMASFNFRIRASFLCGMISRRSIKGVGEGSRGGARDNHSHSPHNLQLFQLAEKSTHTQRQKEREMMFSESSSQVQVGIGFWSRWSRVSPFGLFGGFFFASVHGATPQQMLRKTTWRCGLLVTTQLLMLHSIQPPLALFKPSPTSFGN